MLRKNLSMTCFLLLLLSIQFFESEAFVYRVITDLLQNNVAGNPVLHERTDWDFDPEAARKSRAIFYEANGFRAAKFIERIGVGVDGKQDERRAEQQQRDYGRLNGQHMINFPGPQ